MKTMMIRIITPIIFCSLIYNNLIAQDYNIRDQELWTSYNVKIDLRKKLTLSINPEIRWNEGMSKFKNFNILIEPSYRINNKLSLELSYRNYQTPTSVNHRIHSSVSLRLKKKKWRFNTKMAHFVDLRTFDHDFWSSNRPEHYLRSKNTIGYSIKRFSITAISDLRFNFDDIKFDLSTNRYGMAFSYDLNKSNSVQITQFINESHGLKIIRNYILSISLESDINLKKFLKTKKS